MAADGLGAGRPPIPAGTRIVPGSGGPVTLLQLTREEERTLDVYHNYQQPGRTPSPLTEREIFGRVHVVRCAPSDRDAPAALERFPVSEGRDSTDGRATTTTAAVPLPPPPGARRSALPRRSLHVAIGRAAATTTATPAGIRRSALPRRAGHVAFGRAAATTTAAPLPPPPRASRGHGAPRRRYWG